jgi:glycosidase
MKNRFLAIAMAVVMIWGAFLSCEPINTEKRSLAGEWKFKADPDRIGLRQGWSDQGFDRSDWDTEMVPGSWSDADYDGFAWYATEIKAENLPAGYHIALVFESIDDNAVIWLDGRLFGKQMGYGIKFFLDIGDKLEDGESHELVIRIEDIGGPGGINGAVYLEPYLNEIDLLRSEASKHQAPAAPEWAQVAPIYEVFVRQHTKEGTFKALSADLDRIKSLGVEVIWLMPIHPIGQVNKKGSVGSPYSVKDYYAASPALGSLDDFKALVKEIHARDMHIILDFVLNHTSWDNPLIKDHPEWYSQNEAGEIIPPNDDWYDVADLNYDNPELREYMLTMLKWWITETDIDGYRFDVAELVPNDFWLVAKQACQSVKQDVFFLAEGKNPLLHLNGHDMTYSWNMWEAMIQMANGNADPAEVKRSYELEEFQYPQGALRMRFTENHDKTRSATLIKDRNLNLTAWAFTALMKGNPMIYAGQEMGVTGEYVPALFEKIPINWSRGDKGISQVMSDVLALRKTNIRPASPFQIIIANNEKQVMAYKHGPLLAFFNFSAEPFNFSAAGMEEILYGAITMNPDSSLTLEAKDFGVIK